MAQNCAIANCVQFLRGRATLLHFEIPILRYAITECIARTFISALKIGFVA